VVAIELMTAAQAIDFHAPLRTSPKLQQLHAKVREITPRFTSDAYWADDLAELQAAVLDGGFTGDGGLLLS
jgi:histidine ammonia-lyase